MAHAAHPHPIRVQANRSCPSHGSTSSSRLGGRFTHTRASVPPMRAPRSGEKFATLRSPSPPKWKPKSKIIRTLTTTTDARTTGEWVRIEHFLSREYKYEQANG